MDDTAQTTHGLVSEVPAPKVAKAAETHLIKDPAAALDAAAKLDPAKAIPKVRKPRKPRAPSTAKRAVKRDAAAVAASVARMAAGRAAKAAQKQAGADNAEQRAAYEAAQLHLVDGYALLPDKAELTLRLADGSAFLDGAVSVPRETLRPQGDRVIYAAAIDVGPDGPPVRVTEAYLIASSGDCVRCEVGSGLSAGAGHHAQIPAGHLLF